MTNFSLNAFSCFSREKMEEAITKEEQRNAKLILSYMQQLLMGKTLQGADTPNFKMAALQAEAWKEEFLTTRNTSGLKLPEPTNDAAFAKPGIICRQSSCQDTGSDLFISIFHGRILPHTRIRE